MIWGFGVLGFWGFWGRGQAAARSRRYGVTHAAGVSRAGAQSLAECARANGRDAFVAESAVVVGDVSLGDEASLMVRRGPARRLLPDPHRSPHERAGRGRRRPRPRRQGRGDHRRRSPTIGHAAVVHGCTIGHRCLIGMGSIVLDGAVIGEDSLVAAGSLVTPGTLVPAKSVVMGRPARVVRATDEEELQPFSRERGELRPVRARLHDVVQARPLNRPPPLMGCPSDTES